MEEEHIDEQPTPPSLRLKLVKIATLTLLFLVIFFSVGYIGMEGTSSSSFCSSCHEMKPEYFTWKNSSHAEVDCVACHTGPGFENLAKEKAGTIEQAIKKQMKLYEAPIRMPKEIPDAACETCHNINTRSFTPSGDLIIPHDKHKTEGVSCMQCHSGVAHGKIADRKMTYQSDYDKWDDLLGKRVMQETKFIKPEMSTCMDCHKVRNAPLECTACHTTGMYPDTHKEKTFKLQNHGSEAAKDLKNCDECHSYMSKEKITGLEEASGIDKFLKQNQKPQISHYDYGKENTYCLACHAKRPPSHNTHFMIEHGGLAKADEKKCLACHEYNNIADSKVTTPSCNTCHPSSHRNKPWRTRHPIPLLPTQKLEQSCYNCHNKAKCASCHVENEKKDN